MDVNCSSLPAIFRAVGGGLKPAGSAGSDHQASSLSWDDRAPLFRGDIRNHKQSDAPGAKDPIHAAGCEAHRLFYLPKGVTMAFLATINVPGYLPMDDDPPTFDTAREAWEYLEGEYNEAVDEADPSDRLDVVNNAFVTYWNHDVPGTVFAPTPGYDGDHDLGLAYCVTVVNEDGEPLWQP